MSFKQYLIDVSIRSSEYAYSDEVIEENIEYFRKCFNDKMSANKALMFLHDYINGDYEI